jgi:hypothetical protein
MTDTILDNRKVEVAARINIEADRIKTVQLQLNVLRNQGILVDLSVSGTGMFTRTATWCQGCKRDRMISTVYLYLSKECDPKIISTGWIF